MFERLRFGVIAFALLAGLAACETTEEKAEKRYQEAVQLIAAGETERGIVALKNVFRLNGEHRDARMLYAEQMQEDGNTEQAFRHYRLVSEQYPDDIEARLALARMGSELGAWDIVREQVEAATEIDEDDPAIPPLRVSVDYAGALSDGDVLAQEAATEAAADLLATHPEDKLLHSVFIDGLTRQQRFSAALDATDRALEAHPEDAQLNQTKLNILARLEDLAGLGQHLKVMVERFPANQEVRTALVRWYVANEDVDGAEAFVREVVARSGDAVEPRIALVQFLTQLRGPEAAIAELDRLIEEGVEADTFRMYRATMVFDAGERAQAIASLEEMIEGRETSDTLLEMKTTLARMLVVEGAQDRARRIVADVLAEDDGNVDALKLQASWLIDEDQVRDAVLSLRTALDQAPADVEALTLLARAYERGGNRELMAESLSRAVDASNAAPAEAIRFARYLVQDEKYLAAEDVLMRSLRNASSDLRLLQMLGQVYLEMNELPRAEQIVQTLRQFDSPEAQSLARGFEAAILQRMQRTDESISLMQSMIDEGQASLAAKTAIIRTRLANEEVAEARAFMNELLRDTPVDDPDRLGVDFLNAALTAAEGDLEAARGIYRGILSDQPRLEAVWRALVATVARGGDLDAAVGITDEALAELPTSVNLRWIKAGLAERAGQIDEAIAIYEDLYAEDSGSTIIANNLASLITTHRRDEESLQRAFVIARRLRGSEVPAFQDTYGWIAHRLGNMEEALSHLEPAAAGLPNDPAVQYHLARTYEALERNDEARSQYERAIALWDGTDLPIAVRARAEFAAFEQAVAAAASAELPDETSPVTVAD